MAQENKLPEVWMRGPIDKIPSLLQPVAHTLLQAAEEIEGIMGGFPDDLLWRKPYGMASVAFHLRHIPGVIDRLFTYSREQQLSPEQLKYLSEEGLETEQTKADDLVRKATRSIRDAVGYLANVDPSTLHQFRGVGRKRLPSTVMGLLFHAAEHTMRHTGQLLVTARVVKEEKDYVK
jgi:uncharacterized damage-inducible protein DinB